ncbi:MAG TPA: hypothetical protein PK325_01025 [Cyclobacteriaceae bacterium]|nr:hypothetical protein [Cyclobacteriaceae bacterium]HMV08148.1 hypothetical protein [Cyclobacteriaceae bacterium]HMX00789.1 hypothetical protein [Cyclobacteriaceae bacterium]HMX49336.1 hypothetical protein [Cyclobacteriaceae bacterium]HMY93592.1 hypothetical protein [Cyclobacteriaceae bacterium]
MDWLTVKNFGRVKYFNISYVIMIGVPVLATIYQSIDSTWLKGYIDFSFPPSFKWMYGASILYAVGIAVYQIFCPSEVKRFDNSDEYVNVYQHLYERAYPDKKYSIILSQLTETQNDTRAKIQQLHQALQSPQRDGEQRKKMEIEYEFLVNLVYPGCVQNFLIDRFDRKVKSKSIAFYVSTLFYIAGTGILSYLIFQRACLVFSI